MRNNLASLISIVTICVFSSCTNGYDEDYFDPKPRSYFRIDFQEKEYETSEIDLPFSFEQAKYSRLFKKNEPNQFNIVYPIHKATLHCTYFSLKEKEFQPLIEDAYSSAYKHDVKATAIQAENFYDPERKVSGLLYNLKGNVASYIQFYATDSLNHFLRGSLYFNHKSNSDSLKPVVSYLKEDIVHLYKTLEWK